MSLQLPHPLPNPDDTPLEPFVHFVQMQGTEGIQRLLEIIKANPGMSIRLFNLIETYAASTRALLADMDEAPQGQRKRPRNLGVGPYGDADDYDFLPAAGAAPKIANLVDAVLPIFDQVIKQQAKASINPNIAALSDALKSLNGLPDTENETARIRAALQYATQRLPGVPVDPKPQGALLDLGTLPGNPCLVKEQP